MIFLLEFPFLLFSKIYSTHFPGKWAALWKRAALWKCSETKLLEFFEKVEDCMEKAFLRPNVLKRWDRSYLYRKKATNLIPFLPPAPSGYKQKTSNRFSINGAFITDESFLTGWIQHAARRGEREAKKTQRLMKKVEEAGRKKARGRKSTLEDKEKGEEDRGTVLSSRSRGRPRKKSAGGKTRRGETRFISPSTESDMSDTQVYSDEDVWQLPAQEDEDCVLLSVEEIRRVRDKQRKKISEGSKEEEESNEYEGGESGGLDM
jgi:hypothetical protein